MRKLSVILTAGLLSLTIIACGQTAENLPEEEAVSVEISAEETEPPAEETEAPATETGEAITEESEISSADYQLEDLAALLGMEDAATADSFGGGEENWTEDKSFYIGRVYQASFYGETMPVYMSCDEEKIVNAVSLWIANGEREVSEEEVEQWVQRVTEFAGTKPTYNDTSSEAGSKVWKWKMDGRFVSIHWTGNILSLSMNPAVGELK